jgi:hypothetical protein
VREAPKNPGIRPAKIAIVSVPMFETGMEPSVIGAARPPYVLIFAAFGYCGSQLISDFRPGSESAAGELAG